MTMKTTVLFTKLMPILLNLYLMLVILMGIFSVDTLGSDVLFGHSAILDLYMMNLSKRFKFCSWHRILIINLLLVSIIQYVMILFDVYVDAQRDRRSLDSFSHNFNHFILQVWVL